MKINIVNLENLEIDPDLELDRFGIPNAYYIDPKFTKNADLILLDRGDKYIVLQSGPEFRRWESVRINNGDMIYHPLTRGTVHNKSNFLEEYFVDLL